MTLLNKSFTLNQQLHRSEKIVLKQGNKDAQTLLFTLTDGGVAIDLTACTVVFFATKPSGATLANSCSVVSATAGKVAYIVTEQTSIESGVLTDCYLQVIKTGIVLNTFNLDVEVLASKNYDTAIATANEFTAFQTAMGDLAAKADTTYVDQNINFASPIGEIKLWATATAPTKHLICDGSLISRTAYAALFAVLGTLYGVGDGSTSFNLPNYQDYFVRGASTTRAVGTTQLDAMQGHWHEAFAPNVGVGLYGLISGNAYNVAATLQPGGIAIKNATNDGTNGTPRVSGETRPVNIAVNYIIRALT